MAKGQSRKPGRDVQGGSGKRGRKGVAAPSHTTQRNISGKKAHKGIVTGGNLNRSARRKGASAVATDKQYVAAHTNQRGHNNSPTRKKPSETVRHDGNTAVEAAPHRSSRETSNTTLSRGRARRGDMHRTRTDKGTFIEGRRACIEALETGMPIRRAIVAHSSPNTDSLADAKLAHLIDQLAAANVEIEGVPRTHLDKLSSHGAHQGIMLEVAPFSYDTLDNIIANTSHSKNALVIVCDHVVDEGNLGAIIRSAEVVGAAGVIVARARAASVGVGAYKTSAGAVLHIPIAQVSNIAAAVDQLRDANFWTIAATEHASATAWESPLYGRVALVVGAEATGISRLVRSRCDLECRLPQRGHVESLNVAQATTVLCYEWLRRSYEGRDGGGGYTAADGESAGNTTTADSWPRSEAAVGVDTSHDTVIASTTRAGVNHG